MTGQCNMCGAVDVVVNDRLYCLECDRVDLASASAASDAVLASIAAAVDVALDGRASPEDVREIVEARITAKLSDRAYSQTAAPLRELAERENANYERRQHQGLVDLAVADLEQQFKPAGGAR